MLVHGDNLSQKEHHKTKYRDVDSKRFLAEIRERYDVWHAANMALLGPSATEQPGDLEIIAQRVELFEAYKNFIDQQEYAEKFDSRSNLHSTVLEEFMYYLFKDLSASFGENALIGKSHAFKDIFFVPPNYESMLQRPYAMIERKDHDFVIGAKIQASFRSMCRPNGSPNDGEKTENIEIPRDYDDVAVHDNNETHLFDIPSIAIECKTYLDKTMLEGSSRAAEELKARNPNGLYLVVMEWIKLTESVNLRKYKVDQIYVLRRQKNTDREFRFLDGYVKKPVDVEVAAHLFELVRNHLTKEWTGGIEHGLQRGWLIE